MFSWTNTISHVPRVQYYSMNRRELFVKRAPGPAQFFLIQCVDGLAARSQALGGTAGALLAATQEKHRRYGGSAWAFAVELRGKIALEGLELLEVLAQEAGQLADVGVGPRPATLIRKWRRAIELVLAFESGEALRAVAAGRA